MSAMEDITESKGLENQLRQAQKMESVGRLAGGVAHDFNNMLSVIIGHTDLALQDLPPDTPLHANLEQVAQAAQRSADLTRQLLAFARRQTIEPRSLDLNDTITSMLKMLRRLIGEDIDLLWKPAAALGQVRIDPTQVDQMLANLAVNARDAIGNGHGKLTIETAMADLDEDYCATHAGCVPGRYTMLAVSDDGCGMDAAMMAQVFEPFFTTKGVGEGTGLGLSTVYGIVKQNSGYVNVYSEPGCGTTFRIYLPVHEDAGCASEPEQLPELPRARGGEIVLLVEDEPTLLTLAEKMLERLGYKTLSTTRPQDALKLAKEHAGEIDLLITDVVMPEMNGKELSQSLLSLYPNIKLLYMSGYTGSVIARQGVLDEGVRFLQKPFSMDSLGRGVREALEN